MTKDGIYKAFAYLNACYGNRFAPSPEDAKFWAEAWGDILSPLRDECGIEEVRNWVRAGNEWPPNPGQVLKSYYEAGDRYLDSKDPNVIAWRRDQEGLPAGPLRPELNAALPELKGIEDG
jgi:hypothetical protein